MLEIRSVTDCMIVLGSWAARWSQQRLRWTSRAPVYNCWLQSCCPRRQNVSQSLSELYCQFRSLGSAIENHCFVLQSVRNF